MPDRAKKGWATAVLAWMVGLGVAACIGDESTSPSHPSSDLPQTPPIYHVGDVKPIRMTGGGRIDYPPGTAEKNTPKSRTFQTFALTVGDKDGDGLPEGKLRFVDHTPAHRLNGRPVNLRSVSWRTYVRTVDACRDAGIEATGTLEVKNTGERHEFRLWACDNGEPGTKDPRDQFSLDVFYSDGVKRWGWGGKLTGGNLQAHFEKTTTTPTTGDLEVRTSTTGSSLDPDGYTVVLDGTTSRAIGVNDRVVFSDLSPGDHTVQLSAVASNCTVSGSNPRTVSVTAGMVTSTTFEVSCEATAPTTGELDVTTATTGDDLDPDGYTVTVDATTSRTIGINTTVRFTDLAEGSHTVELGGVASNCTVSGENPRSVSVTAGAVASTTFSVTCETTGDGAVTTRITGLGAIGTSGAAVPGTDWQTFDFEATDAPGGRVAYTDYGVVREDGSVATLTVDPSADPSTAITAFGRSTTDPACVSFGGTARLDTGELVDFSIDACDYGSPGVGLDLFAIFVPSRPYQRGPDRLAEGEITLSTTS